MAKILDKENCELTLAAIQRWEKKFGENWLQFLGPGERDVAQVFWAVYFAYDPTADGSDKAFNEWNEKMPHYAVLAAFREMVGLSVVNVNGDDADASPLADE